MRQDLSSLNLPSPDQKSRICRLQPSADRIKSLPLAIYRPSFPSLLRAPPSACPLRNLLKSRPPLPLQRRRIRGGDGGGLSRKGGIICHELLFSSAEPARGFKSRCRRHASIKKVACTPSRDPPPWEDHPKPNRSPSLSRSFTPGWTTGERRRERKRDHGPTLTDTSSAANHE